MKYNPQRELRVVWIVKELGLASIEEVEQRYQDLFEEECRNTNLIMRRWKARKAFVIEDKRYKIANVPPWFKSLRMPQLIHLNKTESKSMLKDIEEFFMGDVVISPRGKWGNFVKLEMTFQAIDPILGGRPSGKPGKTVFPRKGEALVVPSGWFKGLVRDNQALMNVVGLHRHIGYGVGYWEDGIETITLDAPIIVFGRGKGVAEYESVPAGKKFTVLMRFPLRGCAINSVEKIQEFFDIIAETPIRGLGANSKAYDGRIKLVEMKELN